MKQTERLKLNLLEAGDPLNAEALNENAALTDAAVTQLRADAAAKIAGVRTSLEELGARLGSAGYNCRINIGSYTGTGTYGESSPTVLQFDLYPVVVVICRTTYKDNYPTILVRPCSYGCAAGTTNQFSVNWGGKSVSMHTTTTYAAYQNNGANVQYNYAVLGVEL